MTCSSFLLSVHTAAAVSKQKTHTHTHTHTHTPPRPCLLPVSVAIDLLTMTRVYQKIYRLHIAHTHCNKEGSRTVCVCVCVCVFSVCTPGNCTTSFRLAVNECAHRKDTDKEKVPGLTLSFHAGDTIKKHEAAKKTNSSAFFRV